MDNLFYAPDIRTNPSLPKEEAQHCLKVLRTQKGDNISLTDGKGFFYQAEITEITPHSCAFRIIQTREQQPSWNNRIEIALAPTKSMERTEWFAEKATEIGINTIAFLKTRYSERKEIKSERIRNILISAMKQSLKAHLPELTEMIDFKQFIGQEFNGQKFIAHCHPGEKPLLSTEYRKGENVLILIGPEGDFSEEEVALAIANGFIPVSLGESRLRTETAALTACQTIHIVNQLDCHCGQDLCHCGQDLCHCGLDPQSPDSRMGLQVKPAMTKIPPAMTDLEFVDWGLIPYAEAYQKQKELFEENIQKKTSSLPTSNTVIFCEHPHVLTLGKNGSQANLLFSKDFLEEKGVELFHVDRGGDITYHGPGQIVGYPIIDLENFGIGLKEYIFRMEEAIIRTLNSYGIRGERLENAIGVWLDPDKPGKTRKICAIGVRSSRFITMHGFALNVNTNLDYFRLINPCGFVDKGVTSLEQELGNPVDINKLKANLQICLQEVFN